jgi:hypothetical protein
MKFRHTAGFGKKIEYWIIGLLLKEGFDVFVPLVDDHGIDAIIRGHNGKSIDLQIKARSKDVALGNAALFAALEHPQVRDNYYFLFYSEKLDLIWFMSSKDLVEQANQNKNGKNVGRRSIWLNGYSTKHQTEYPKKKFQQWCITKEIENQGKWHDFSMLHNLLY